VVTDADLDIIVQKLLGPPEHVSGAPLLTDAIFQPRVLQPGARLRRVKSKLSAWLVRAAACILLFACEC